MEKCISLHKDKPWVKNFDTVLIYPLRSVNNEWLGEAIQRPDGKTWYIPTKEFWDVHCQVSHNGGTGCNVKIHTAFLTADGKNAEFLYGNLLKNGEMIIQTQQDFEQECEWWAKYIEGMSYVKNNYSPSICVQILLFIFILFVISLLYILSKK